MSTIERDHRGAVLRAASTLALAGLLATSCDSQAEQDREEWQAPYQLATALVTVPSPRPAATVIAPPARLAADRKKSASAFARALAPSPAAVASASTRALTIEHASIPVGGLAPLVPSDAAETAVDLAVTRESPVATVGMGRESGVPADLAYIPQISASDRAAYIAQVDAAAPGQRMAVRSGDEVLGEVEFQVADGRVSVRIGQVLDLFAGKMDGAEFASLRASSAASEFVALDRLQAAGIPLDYNAAYDELTLETDRS